MKKLQTKCNSNATFLDSIMIYQSMSGDADSSTSYFTMTGDSYVTEFNGDAANVISNGYTLYVNGVALTGTK